MNPLAIVFLIFFLVGIVVVDSILDWLFIAVYALAVTAILNNMLHLYRYHKKHGEICSSDLIRSLWYLLMGAGAVFAHYMWF